MDAEGGEIARTSPYPSATSSSRGNIDLNSSPAMDEKESVVALDLNKSPVELEVKAQLQASIDQKVDSLRQWLLNCFRKEMESQTNRVPPQDLEISNLEARVDAMIK